MGLGGELPPVLGDASAEVELDGEIDGCLRCNDIYLEAGFAQLAESFVEILEPLADFGFDVGHVGIERGIHAEIFCGGDLLCFGRPMLQRVRGWISFCL